MLRTDLITHALLRIVAGGLLAFHGAQKLFGFLATHPGPAAGSQMWVGGIIELVGGILVCIGLFTRIAAFLCSGMLAVAYFQFHWKLQLGSAVFPIVNGGELAVVYCFVFLMVWAHGAGIWSIDALRGRTLQR